MDLQSKVPIDMQSTANFSETSLHLVIIIAYYFKIRWS